MENVEKYLYGNLNYHKLVLTKTNNKVIEYNNKTYGLFEINTIYNKITINDLYKSAIALNNNAENIVDKWKKLWILRIDYIEYQMNELNNKYNLLSKITCYYIGMTENAIQLLENMDNVFINNYISHKRVKYNTNTYELYNPSLCVIDSKVRDIAEYYKNEFFYTEISFGDLLNNIYMNLTNFEPQELQMFFIRMLYPSYFFDLYDRIIMGLDDEKKLDVLISKNSDYEKMLKKILIEIKKRIYIDNIDWLN